MADCFLSIAIAYCDKDERYIPSLLEKLEDRVHVPYEVVLMDNTSHGSLCGGIRLGCSHRNFSRHYMADFCHGEYIWFFDADDDPLDVPAELADLPDGDIIEFGPEWTQNLWDKWLRASLCREKFRRLGDYPITYKDDLMMLIALGWEPGKEYSRVDRNIYVWNKLRSGCFVPDPAPEKIRHLLEGAPYYRRQLEEVGRPGMLPYVFAEWLKYIFRLERPAPEDFRALCGYPAMTPEDLRKAARIALSNGARCPADLMGLLGRLGSLCKS